MGEMLCEPGYCTFSMSLAELGPHLVSGAATGCDSPGQWLLSTSTNPTVIVSHVGRNSICLAPPSAARTHRDLVVGLGLEDGEWRTLGLASAQHQDTPALFANTEASRTGGTSSRDHCATRFIPKTLSRRFRLLMADRMTRTRRLICVALSTLHGNSQL